MTTHEPATDVCEDVDPDLAARSMVGWHVLFVIMTLGSFAVMAANGHAPLAAVGLAVLTVAYVALVVPAERRHSLALGVAFLAVAYAVLVLLELQDRGALVLLFALYPLGFVLLPRAGGIAATVVLTVAFSLVLVAVDGWTAEAWFVNGLAAVGYIVFALVMGLFIDGLIRESRRNRGLLAELRATQAELARAEREAGALAERERLAGEIHDTLAQGFTSIVMLAQAGEAAVARSDDATTSRRLTEIQDTARDGLAEARALVAAMSPPALDGEGLVTAIERLSARFAAETGTPVDFTVTGDPRGLTASSDVAALRATQESLANVRKHAGASHVRVVLAYDEDGATVAVSDDGAGFDTSATRTGYGLDGLRARLESVGGLAEVESSPGAGTRVRVRVP